MPPKKPTPPINQTAIGDGNIQVAGDGNTVTVNQTIIQRVTNFFSGGVEQQRAMRNRRAMLDLVKNTWVKGVLEKSLYAEILIELGIETTPNAVIRSWDVQVQMPHQANRSLPTGTSLAHVFDALNGTMLILGEPGSGKTTMLLELARDKIARAEKNLDLHIPVVFNLSSWVNPNQSIANWLVSELIIKYSVSRKIANSWMENDELLLLLDGLDEVKAGLRNKCIEAINDFRIEHGSMPIAVCSRTSDYAVLSNKLSLRGAVLLQPLTFAQIDEYFERAGNKLTALHQIVLRDAILHELVRQPLMLSITVMAYQNIPERVITSKRFEMADARRRHLFDTYILQMFNRLARTRNERYSPEQVKKWLIWLAQNMTKQGQSIFLLERMQKKWLETRFQIILCGIFAKIIVCSVPSLGILLFSILRFGSLNDLGFVSIFLFVVLTSFWIVDGLLSEVLGKGMLDFLQINPHGEDEIERPTEVLNWTWRKARPGIRGGLLAGLALQLIFSLMGAFGGDLVSGLLLGLTIGVPVALAGSVSFGLLFGFTRGGMEITTTPNQGIWQSLKNAVVASLLIGLVFGLDVGLVAGPILGSASALFFCYFSFLGFGGYAVVYHYVLRFFLFLGGHMPWNYIRFLDYSAERIFLRKVGGGYIFVHRLLMEYFADMYPADEK